MKRKRLEELQEIARCLTSSALESYEIPETYRDLMILEIEFDGDYRIFELYVPGEMPKEALVISRARIHSATGLGQVEIFNLVRKAQTN